MAELWFASVADVKVAYEGPEGKELFDHEHHFLESVEWFLAEEIDVPLTAGP
jgi:hypothetical protein